MPPPEPTDCGTVTHSVFKHVPGSGHSGSPARRQPGARPGILRSFPTTFLPLRSPHEFVPQIERNVPDSIRYQVQDSQRVQERRGDDEWAGTDAVGVEWCRRTGPGRPDWLHRSICLSRAIARSGLTDILTHRLWDGYPLSLHARARVRTLRIPSQEAPPVRSSCAA